MRVSQTQLLFLTNFNFQRPGNLSHRIQESCMRKIKLLSITIQTKLIISLISLSEELTFWGISELFVEPCCQEIYYGRKDQMKKASSVTLS